LGLNDCTPAGAETGPPQVRSEGIAALWADGRFRVASLFIFPVLVWLISAPLVSAIESQISLFLLRKVVTVVAFVFDMLGYPLEQQGNVLMLPKGPVGVADACSGIRSLTACLFAGSFLGAAFFAETWKKVTLVGAAMFFAFVMNLGRSLFLTGWAYAYGPDAINGTVHDAAGYAVLGLTCVGLLVLVPLLNLKLASPGDDAKPV
jgi:exosortase